jgi:2-iminobutanoate/2-iminopropanoate deaminase
MSRRIANTDRAPLNPSYSQAVHAAGLVFVSGQAGIDPATGEPAGDSIQSQTRQARTNIATILDAGGQLDRQVRQRHIHPRRPGRLPRHER